MVPAAPAMDSSMAAAGETSSSSGLTDLAAERMSPAVSALASRGGREPVELIVSYATALNQQEIDRAIALGAEVQRSFTALRLVSLRVPAEAL